ncbi:MAG TPA: NYN domain-containing protein [Naasia sp.]|jgi:uncharacterized LabA/DUF88 family protein
MADQVEGRVAVYIDFDNIVISRYDQLHGNQAWRNDNARNVVPAKRGGDATAKKLAAAEIDVGAILDYASSFGTVALSRAYADWSVPANASYRHQLVDRAVDLTQLFPVTRAFKNGADIRLSVDVLEDLFRLPDLTHVIIVAGDSDYIALAQRCKRLGRFVVGVGVTGRTAAALIAACDSFEMYDAIPGASDAADEDDDELDEPQEAREPQPVGTKRRVGTAVAAPVELPPVTVPAFVAPVEDPELAAPSAEMSARAATKLLVRALQLLGANNDEEFQDAAAVKAQIRRLDPSFSERALGYRSFTDFAKSRNSLVEVRTEGADRGVKLR